jgi:small subunit ribosomal protein S6
MLILPPDADDAVIGRVTDRISQTLGERSGEISKIDRWGKRRLAYDINRQSEGFYLIAECRADPTTMKELDRVLVVADDVIRFKIVVRGEADGQGEAEAVPEVEAPAAREAGRP